MLWSLTEKGDAVFPNRHGELTVGLLDAVKEVYGDDGLQQLVTARAVAQAAEYAKLMPGPDATVEARVEALAEQRSAEGYMAEVVREDAGSFLLIEHHCPICDAARCCVGLCTAELSVFRQALGDDVTVERTAHLLDGDHRCVYRVEKKGN